MYAFCKNFCLEKLVQREEEPTMFQPFSMKKTSLDHPPTIQCLRPSSVGRQTLGYHACVFRSFFNSSRRSQQTPKQTFSTTSYDVRNFSEEPKCKTDELPFQSIISFAPVKFKDYIMTPNFLTQARQYFLDKPTISEIALQKTKPPPQHPLFV